MGDGLRGLPAHGACLGEHLSDARKVLIEWHMARAELDQEISMSARERGAQLIVFLGR